MISKFKIFVAAALFCSPFAHAQQAAPGGAMTAEQMAQLMRPRVNSHWKMSVGIGFSGFQEMKSNRVKLTTSTSQMDGQFDQNLSESLRLSVDSAYMPANSVGFIGGISYDTDSTFRESKIKLGDYTAKSTGSDARISTITLAGSLVFRNSVAYLPVGLNVSAYRFTPDPSDESRYSLNGGLGGQIGLGFFTGPTASIEFWYRLTAFSMTQKAEGMAVDVNNARLTSANMMAKYWF